MKPPVLPRRARLASLPFASMLLLAVVLHPAVSFAQAAPQGGHFELSGDYAVEIGGKEAPKATLYQSKTPPAYLLIAPELASPVLISAVSGKVESLDLMKVARKDFVVDLLPQASLASEGAWRMDGENIAFSVGGKSVRLKPRPWLLGSHTGAELLDHDPSYGQRAATYTPIADVLSRVRSAKGDVRVLAFFGSWCPHCKENLPSLLKLEQVLKGSALRFDYYGVPTPFGKEPEAARWGIKGVPTAVILVGGKEVGRITGTQWGSPESAIYEALKAASVL